ncbi:MAG: ZIP family metal transporter [Clostridia bacterium]|nr:ZIP family metal transporter [Clostridia bacterium]MBR3152203.1 ZIP family metal transporter [Clostridia bacterium]MBR3152260.1 ZIP family metal transporter [Clostridia bacterium]
MYEIVKTTFAGLFFGMFGTTIGGFLGSSFDFKSNKTISFILEFAAGLMLSIICFELIPESLKITDISISLLGIMVGVIGMIFCENRVKKLERYKTKGNSLLTTGIVIGIGLAIHNFPEGIAIGSGFESSMKLGLSVAIAILIHDIPEGISIAVPLKQGGMSRKSAIFYTALSGVSTGIGAFFGCVLGNISESFVSFSLAFAAGAMLYIVSGELIPESKKMYKGRFPVIGNIIGFLLGLVAMHV